MIAAGKQTTLRPVRPQPRHRHAGLTLIESVVLISILGVVASVVIPTFARAVETSKLTEATSELAAIYVGVASYYAEPRPLPQGGRGYCLPGAAGPTPEKPSAQPVGVPFATMPAWQALGFAPERPLRFRYTYSPAWAGCQQAEASAAQAITLRAEGDLDGDGVLSTFERTAHVAGPGLLSPDAVLHVTDRVE